MKNIRRILLVSTFAAISGLLIPSTSYSAVKPTEESAPKLPEIWEQAGPRERLKATRAAELDADRLLAERLYGVRIDSTTTVGDLAMLDDSIIGTAGSTLVGSLTVGQPEYFADGRVEVVKAVKIEQVIETIRRKTKEKLRADGTRQTVAFDEKTELSAGGKTLEVMGNAALPGSLGQQKAMAKRAAELDAYRRLAQRLMDIRIDSKTTVRDACLESDELVASLSRVVKGAEPISIRYLDDGTCEVRMEVKKQDLVRAVSNSSKGRTHTTRIEDSVRDNTFIETGRGAMHPVLQGANVPAGVARPTPPDNAPQDKNAGADIFFETETIIRQLLESKSVLR